jgi:hypothetical protein
MARMIHRWSHVAVPAVLVALALNMGSAGMAEAYVGPGAGLTAIGSVLALFAAIGLAVVGFVWYPVKRMLKRKSAGVAEEDVSARGRQ